MADRSAASGKGDADVLSTIRDVALAKCNFPLPSLSDRVEDDVWLKNTNKRRTRGSRRSAHSAVGTTPTILPSPAHGSFGSLEPGPNDNLATLSDIDETIGAVPMENPDVVDIDTFEMDATATRHENLEFLPGATRRLRNPFAMTSGSHTDTLARMDGFTFQGSPAISAATSHLFGGDRSGNQNRFVGLAHAHLSWKRQLVSILALNGLRFEDSRNVKFGAEDVLARQDEKTSMRLLSMGSVARPAGLDNFKDDERFFIASRIWAASMCPGPSPHGGRTMKTRRGIGMPRSGGKLRGKQMLQQPSIDSAGSIGT